MAGLASNLCILLGLVVCCSVLTRAVEKGEYKVGCYITYWSLNSGAFSISKIDPQACTHVFYSFVQIKDDKLAPYDDDTKFSQYIQELKDVRNQYPGLKIIASVGGANTKGEVFLALTETQAKMDAFADDAVTFLQLYDFDGLDVDWEAAWCYQGWDTEKNAAFLSTLSVKFKAAGGARPLLLTAALVPVIDYPTFYPNCTVQDSTNRPFYNLPSLSQSLDLANLMAYDLTGSWNSVTGLHSALNGSGDTVVKVVSHYLATGLVKEKLVLGIPMYGRSWTLNTTSETGIGAPANGAGDPETPFYNEICKDNQATSWSKVYDVSVEGPYAFDGDQWVGYEDVQSALVKASYIKTRKLNGGFFWSLEMDDLTNACGEGNSPLVHGVAQSLAGYTVGCYITYWSLNSGAFSISQIDPKCTHIFYAFVQIKNDQLAPYDDDLQFAQRMVDLKTLRLKNPALKIIASVGGGTTGGHVFLALTETQAKMDAFATSTINFLRLHDLDGLDVDWEAGWCYHDWDTAKNAALLSTLGTAFRADGGSRKLLLTAALLPVLDYPTFYPNCSIQDATNRQFYDLPSLANSLDLALLMTYDLTGSWVSVTGLHSALYGTPAMVTVDQVVDHFLAGGMPVEKAVMGIAVYGRAWTLADTSQTGLGAPATGPGNPETPFYGKICQDVQKWTRTYDKVVKGPYTYKGKQWVGYEDVESSAEKATYVKDEQLSGAFFWALEMDDLSNSCGDGNSPIVHGVATSLNGEPTSPKPTTPTIKTSTSAGPTTPSSHVSGSPTTPSTTPPSSSTTTTPITGSSCRVHASLALTSWIVGSSIWIYTRFHT